MAVKKIYVPFGQLQPDAKLFGNDGLMEARNVIPVYGNYISTQFWAHSGNEPVDEPYGLHLHFAGGTTRYAYVGSITKLYEFAIPSFGATDKSRTAGGAYATSSAGGENGWQCTSFGDAIVMTQFVDDPQLLTSPAAANFVKLATTSSATIGMDPKAKFVYAIGGNLHLANLNLSAAFDTLPIGANPTVVAWSGTESIRQFGSFNVTPEIVGTDYQPLNYDLGHITGVIGSHKFALVFMQKGIVREDGPPYTFQPIVVGASCRYPNSIVIYDGDVYFWGPAGPSVLRGGQAPVIILGDGRVARTLIDNAVSGFSPINSISDAIEIRHVNAAIDTVNGLVYWSFTNKAGTMEGRTGNLSVVYNVRDDRFSFVDNMSVSFGAPSVTVPGLLFLRHGPDLGGPFSPGRDLVGMMRYIDESGPTTHYQLAVVDYGGISALLTMLLTRGYQQFDANLTTRITRVRPIFSRSDLTLSITITLLINSKNRPYEIAAATTSTEADAHGWIVSPECPFKDFHQVSLSFDGSDLETIVELEGFEVEYVTGGVYSG